ncbi:hypothetical protein HGT70_04715 [Rosenbergiella collisarenosi]|uniref:hypothetical protein n=1 Tax=Rosenbergiella collisarenosi TaxID=1544695 RepID=UPI001BDB61E2|nr:hypothetical protein [Rosenbergiella collisarenosi]MBT0720586.1 hypothetical protein [Rosenbergiella collisarenosi]
MKAQLAHLYRGDQFMGYGLAVDGQLVDRQVSVDISTSPNELSTATVVFYLDGEMTENPVRVDLDEFKCQR